MWFDLALALGMTVTDLKARMPMDEFGAWFAYVELHGPVDYRRRYDEPAALVAHTTQWSNGGKMEYKDFIRPLPKPYEAAKLSEIDMQVIKATQRNRKK
jgi:hypothetical protein